MMVTPNGLPLAPEKLTETQTLMLYLGPQADPEAYHESSMRGRLFLRKMAPHCYLQRWDYPDGSSQNFTRDYVAQHVALLAQPGGAGPITEFITWPEAIERVYQLAGVAGVGILDRAHKSWGLAYDEGALYAWALRVQEQRVQEQVGDPYDEFMIVADGVLPESTASPEMKVGPEALGPGLDQPREIEVADAVLDDLVEAGVAQVATLLLDERQKPGTVREFGHRLVIHPDDLEAWKKDAHDAGMAVRIETMATAGGVN